MPEHKTKSQLNDALLKPPEIQRDATTGRFGRKGPLAKAAKFRPHPPAKRRPGGRPFQPGVSGNPAGKPRGTLNWVTRDLKTAILQAGEIAGGKEGLTGYLVLLARNNSSAYAGLLAKILPSVLAADADSRGGNVEIRFVRHIVYPSGRIESDDRPKQLPAPDASTDDTKH